MSASDLAELRIDLARIGLSEAEQTVYVRLLRGERSVRDLAQPPLTPGDAHAAVKRLLTKSLIGKGKGASTYYAIDPSIAWQAAIASIVWTRDVSLAAIWDLPLTDDQAVDDARHVLDRIRVNAAVAYVDQVDLPAAGKQFVVQHAHKIEQTEVEAISSARDVVRAVSRTPRWPRVSRIWTAISSGLDRGIHYQRITDLPELVDHGLAVIRRDVYRLGIKLMVLETDEIGATFYLVDDDLVIARETTNRAMISARRRTVGRFRSTFGGMEAAAVPAQLVLPVLRRSGDRLKERAAAELGPEGVNLLDDLIRYGRFALPDHGQSSNRDVVLSRALELGIVRISEVGDPVPAYDLAAESVLPELRTRGGSADEEPPCLSCLEPEQLCRC